MDQDQSPARPQGGNASRSPSPRHDDEPRRTSRTEGRSSGTPERLDGARHLAAAFADSEPSQPRAVSMTGAQGWRAKGRVNAWLAASAARWPPPRMASERLIAGQFQLQPKTCSRPES